MQPKTVTLDGTDYTVAPIRTGDAKQLRAKFETPEDYNIAFVAASLRAGGDSSVTPDSAADLAYFSVFLPLLGAAMEVNGLTAAGEDQAAAKPDAADSTSDSSTPQ